MTEKQNATGGGGILTAQSRGDYHPHFTTIAGDIQPLDDLLAQAARRMGEAEILGDDAAYVNHFSIWLELHSLKRRWRR